MFEVMMIVAMPFVILGVTAYYIAIAVIRHRERMAGLEDDSHSQAENADRHAR
jgi:hypothetical protein